MRTAHLLVVIAFLVHALAWFLPVVKGEVTFPMGLPGWQAFRVAASAVWPYEGVTIGPWYFIVLWTMSAATTVFFVLGSAWAVAMRSRRLRRVSTWIAACAFVVNAHCLGLGSDLRIGYFLWWVSFLLLAMGLFLLSRATHSR